MKKNKRKIYKLVFLRILSIVLLLFAAFVVYKGYFLYTKFSFLQEQSSQLQAKLNKLEESKKELEQKIQLASSSYGQQKRLREEFNMGYPGEQLIILLNEEEDQAAQDSIQNDGFLRRIQTWIKSLW